MDARARASWVADLARPVPVGAAVALAVNDHVLKGAGVLPGAVTGKLSDVAGLFAGGVLAVVTVRAVVRAVRGREVRRDGPLAIGVLACVGAAFVALKLWPAFNAAVAAVWGVNVLDASDLWALPVLALAWCWLRDREVSERRTTLSGARTTVPGRFARGLACAGVLLACAATPAPPPVPPRPVAAWDVGEARLALPCGEAVAWVSKSGKTGAGLTVRVTPGDGGAACDARIAGATLTIGRDAIAGEEIPLTAPPTGASDGVYRVDDPRLVVARSTYHYVAFTFDGEARWNRGERTGTFAVELELGGARRTWTLPALHHMVQLDEPRRSFW